MTDKNKYLFYLSTPVVEEWKKTISSMGMVPSRRLEVLIKKDLEELKK